MAAVYGGDGSVVNAAVGLLEKDIPLMIFPGGTGNVIAKELGARSASENQPTVPEQPGGLQIWYHWQARAINIKTDPPQKVSLDGEMIGETPSKITLLPQAVEIIVPATA